jgi:tRNA dimethylallyltransferase
MVVSKKVIALIGPTASGKTGWAKKLIKKFPLEAISADSRQVYRGLDLGSGKDKSFTQYLIDIVEPQTYFTVAQWQKLAREKIEEISQKGKIPLIVGGTGLYIDSLIYGFQFPKTDLQLQKEIRQKLNKFSIEKLVEILKALNPKAIKKIDTKNPRRLIRAIEIALLSSRSYTKQKEKPPYNVLILGIDLPRKELYQKIDQRVDERMNEGMLEEVEGLIKKGVSKKWLKSLGLEYRFLTQYLEGERSEENLEKTLQKLKFAIHAFARRQLTWFRRNEAPRQRRGIFSSYGRAKSAEVPQNGTKEDKNINWVKNYNQAEKVIKKFIKQQKYLLNP